MNKEIRRAIGELTPEPDAKDRIYNRLLQTEANSRSVKSARSFSRRAVAFAAAAAVLGTGAIGAGAYAAYNNGFFNGAKALYPNTELSDKDIDNIAGITGDWNGEVIENTFDGLDFTIDGTVNDGQTSCVMLTVSRTRVFPRIRSSPDG
ncbi:MAG: hypothetical protein IIZ29_03515 [Schwartzia sp.]|nr:hypothetical protein [Schwartzia sp. (in: firmicutes)]